MYIRFEKNWNLYDNNNFENENKKRSDTTGNRELTQSAQFAYTRIFILLFIYLRLYCLQIWI